MQLGMVGLGRMGANLVRRLMRDGHECVVFDVDADAVRRLEGEGATGAASLEDFVSRLTAPRAAWVMVPAGFTGATVEQLAELMQPDDVIIDGGNSNYRDDIARSAELAERGIHYVDVGTSGGVFGLERGFCLMIGGEQEVVARLDPLFRTIAPGIDAAPRTPGADEATGTAEQGYLHCGPSGAGHFVKMVHNGIEYGLMAAYAEGLNILHAANAGARTAEVDAETTPLRDPELYRYDIDTAAVAEVWRRGSVVASWLLDLTAAALHESPELEGFGGRVSDSGEGRWTVQAAIDVGVPAHVAQRRALRPVRLPRRGPVRRPVALGDAQPVRRPRREGGGRRRGGRAMSADVAERPAAQADGIARPDDHVIVLFGATGDLARRKLLPGLLHLAQTGLMPAGFRIVGVSREPLDDDGFRAHARAAVEEFGRAGTEGWDAFAERLSYLPAGDPPALAAAVGRARDALGGPSRVLHYLSVPPAAFAGIARDLGAAGLADDARVIMEKPFGTDLASARALNAAVHEVFAEEQVFRIDHFLGKEAVQNLLALRFANGLFEPIWNRQHIAYVQIDVPETLSIGTRAAFYEPTGALRDMIVTHLLQVLGFVAMEPPTALEPGPLVDEKVKVFESLRPLTAGDVVRGQYEGYRDEPGVAADSQTETFVAVRAHVDNWRWEGVPFYLRTGKRMASTRRLLTLAFREPPRRIFPESCRSQVGTDRLLFDLGDPGAVTAELLTKTPGPTFVVSPATMRMSFGEEGLLEAYERLIHDAMLGDHTLFTRADGIERLWAVCAGVLDDPPPVEASPQGSWGPQAAQEMVSWTLR